MSDTEPNQEDIDATDAAIAELQSEITRVAVDLTLVAKAFSHIVKHSTNAAEDKVTVGIDVFTTLRIIRALPDNAGTNAFLVAFGLPVESAS
jgi:hypothetical protein